MVTTRQFVNALAKNAGMTTGEVTDMLSHFTDIIVESVKADQTINMQGFGSFEQKKKAEKCLYNPNTKQMRLIPASLTITFKQSPKLKERLTGANKAEEGKEQKA